MSAPATPSPSNPLRLALIGAGAMGANYVRALQNTTDVRLTALVDHSVTRAHHLGAAIGARAAAHLDHAGPVDAAIVAVPTADHADVAVPLLRAGLPCLVEKPLALDAKSCDALQEAAAVGSTVLQVGHVERFNAAVVALRALNLPRADIAQLTARRMNAGSARVLDIDVVLDLMVHDLDVVMALKGEPVTEVRATGSGDHATAALVFADGSTAEITASRVTPGRTRDLALVMKDGTPYALDYIERSLRRGDAAVPVTGDANPLGRQVSAFAASIRTGTKPAVSADDAIAVMQVVWRIQRSLGLA